MTGMVCSGCCRKGVYSVKIQIQNLKFSLVHSRGSDSFWRESIKDLREFLNLLIDIEKSLTISNNFLISFHRVADLYKKSFVGCGVSINVSLEDLSEKEYSEKRDIGTRNLNILKTSMIHLYLYKLATVIMSCSTNNGFECSLR